MKGRTKPKKSTKAKKKPQPKNTKKFMKPSKTY